MLRSLQMVATPFGISVSSEIFQKKLLEAFDSLEVVVCVVWWRDHTWKDTWRPQQTYRSFPRLMQRENVMLNKEKLVLRSDNITFMGHKITKKGLQTDRQKIEAITDYPIPQSWGTSPFPGHGKLFVTIPAIPHWGHSLSPEPAQEECSMDMVRLTRTRILDSEKNHQQPYNCLLRPEERTHNSEWRKRLWVWQEGGPVAFAGRTLSNTERNHAQIQKEMLAAMHGLGKKSIITHMDARSMWSLTTNL